MFSSNSTVNAAGYIMIAATALPMTALAISLLKTLLL